MKFACSLAIIALCTASAPAAAERIVSSVSTHQVMISSNFTGLDLVLFGTVERDAASVPRKSGYDLVMTVTGPKDSTVTRRKERTFGIWVNVESRAFIDVPSYLAVMSSRPMDNFVNVDIQRRLQLGLRRTLLPQQIGNDLADTVREDPFREAFLRLKETRHLYVEQVSGVTNSAFEIVKVGFEQFVYSSAQNNGLLYGLATVMLALLTGWFASVVFRRD